MTNGPHAAAPDPEALLLTLRNYERSDRQSRGVWSLDQVRTMLGAAAELPCRAVQVGGSKGKGTTVLYLESMARAAGLRVGCFLSPHLHSVCERVRLDGAAVEPATLHAVLQEMLSRAERLDVQLSYFEALTLAAHQLFGAKDLDLAVFEVGLGGRLDSTTAIPVDASILTRVELEHTDVLGDTVAAIATEKAYVIRADRPAYAVGEGDERSVFEARAQEVGAQLSLLPGDLRIEVGETETARWAGHLHHSGTRQSFVLEAGSGFELQAMALAWACLGDLFPERSFELEPVPRPSLPGRFEVLPQGNGVVVLDGAHTAHSLGAVAKELQRRFSEQLPAVVVFACAADKDWRSGLKPLLPIVDRFFVTTNPTTASADPEHIVAWLRDNGGQGEVVANGSAALRQALDVGREVCLVTGSFYLAGELRQKLLGKRA